MTTFLDRLYAAKAASLPGEEAREPYDDLVRRALARRPERRSFVQALRDARGPAIIAEIKRASPSVGLIARNFDAALVASRYELAGVDAISVLTEADHFLGDLSYLDVARAHGTRPVLRKDFLSTPYHIVQSAAYGADAVLLIVAGLDERTLRALSAEAARFALDTLVEVHDEAELAVAASIGARIVGINNRDLRTFATDLGVTQHLLPSVPAGTIAISESGVTDPADVATLYECGARGFLIGEALMRADDPSAFVEGLKAVAGRR